MRRNVMIILGLIAIGLTVYTYNPVTHKALIQDSKMKNTSLSAPDFSFMSLDNRKYELKNFAGKLILLHFWASWCAPCVTELPSLIKLAHDYPNQIVIIALSNDHDSKTAKQFLQKRSIKTHSSTIIWAWDKDKTITHDLFQTIMLPETIIVDRHFNMVKKYVGDTKWNSPEIRSDLNEILKSK